MIKKKRLYSLNVIKNSVSNNGNMSYYLQNFLSTIWYILPGAYSLLWSLSFLSSGMNVSLKQTRNNKQGKLSKAFTAWFKRCYK